MGSEKSKDGKFLPVKEIIPHSLEIEEVKKQVEKKESKQDKNKRQ